MDFTPEKLWRQFSLPVSPSGVRAKDSYERRIAELRVAFGRPGVCVTQELLDVVKLCSVIGCEGREAVSRPLV